MYPRRNPLLPILLFFAPKIIFHRLTIAMRTLSKKTSKNILYYGKSLYPFALRVFYFARNKKCLEWVTDKCDIAFNDIICKIYVSPHPFETFFIRLAHEKSSGRTGISNDLFYWRFFEKWIYFLNRVRTITITRNSYCVILLITTTHLFGTETVLIPRSQSFNAARQMIGWNNPNWGINRLPQEESYASFNLTFAYTRSFKPGRIAYSFFGDDLNCACDGTYNILVTGSDVPGRSNTDWLADYFGLQRDFESIVTIAPRIDNFILDFSLYAGLDGWVEGLYFRIHGPYVNTRWTMNASEVYYSPGFSGYFQGYFSSVEVPGENLNRSFLDYTSGRVPTINNNYDLYDEKYCETYGPCSPLGPITWSPLCCSKISNDCYDTLAYNGFAELRFVLGYNFINDEDGDYHLGAGLYCAAPTGNKVGGGDASDSKGHYLFQPIVGNGKHWELGAQITAHHIWWRSEYENASFGFYLEANVTHLFAASQTRCFDLCSAGNNSRYMLAQKLSSNADTSTLLNLATDSRGLAFDNAYAPVANLTRRNVTSTIAAQGDIAFTLAYQVSGFQWDVGYNYWCRSGEKLRIQKNCCNAMMGTWALKGDQRVYGFTHVNDTSLAVALAATDSNATINFGSNINHNVDYEGDLPLAPKNFYANNPIPAAGGLHNTDTDKIYTLPLGSEQIYTSSEPVLIQECDFNLAGTSGFSNKLFTHFNWAWAEGEERTWTPYLGMGAELEFGSSKQVCCQNCSEPGCDVVMCSSAIKNCVTSPSCSPNYALSQWGIWLKVGSSYN